MGFAGVLVMLPPGDGSFDLAAGRGAWLAASASALSIILVRKLSATETTASIAFYTNAVVLVLMACLLPIGFVPPTLADLALMALAGLTGGAALMLLIAGLPARGGGGGGAVPIQPDAVGRPARLAAVGRPAVGGE